MKWLIFLMGDEGEFVIAARDVISIEGHIL